MLAVGRCRRCDRPFCATHQARNNLSAFVDLCHECLIESERRSEQEQFARRQSIVDRITHVIDRLNEEAVPMEPRQQVSGYKTQSFRRRQQPVIEDLEPAWPIGDFLWGTDCTSNPTGITAAGDIVVMGTNGFFGPSGPPMVSGGGQCRAFPYQILEALEVFASNSGVTL